MSLLSLGNYLTFMNYKKVLHTTDSDILLTKIFSICILAITKYIFSFLIVI